jgi:hypothetical protein
MTKLEKMRQKLASSNQRPLGVYFGDSKQMNFSVALQLPTATRSKATLNLWSAGILVASLSIAYILNEFIQAHKEKILALAGIERITHKNGPTDKLTIDQKGLFWGLSAYAPNALATVFDMQGEEPSSREKSLVQLRNIWPNLTIGMQTRIEDMRTRIHAPPLLKATN